MNGQGDLDETAGRIHAACGEEPIAVAMLVGPGLEGITEGIVDARTVRYGDLPGFPVPPDGSPGEGSLVVAAMEGVRIAFLQGYGSHSDTGVIDSMAFPFEVLTLLGCTTLITAGGVTSVRADCLPGHLVSIVDHINLSGLNPLIGAASGGFMSLADAYDPRLQRRLRRATISAGVTYHDAIEMYFPGPVFATTAEARIARTLGADVIGHAFLPELILARRLGLRCASLATVAGFSAGFQSGNPTHASFRAGCQQGVISLRRLWRGFLRATD